MKGILAALEILNWLIKGYTKHERDKRIAKIKADPNASFAGKFGKLRKSTDLPSDSARTDGDRDTAGNSDSN